MSKVICIFVLSVVKSETGSGSMLGFAEGRLLDVVFGEDSSNLSYKTIRHKKIPHPFEGDWKISC